MRPLSHRPRWHFVSAHLDFSLTGGTSDGSSPSASRCIRRAHQNRTGLQYPRPSCGTGGNGRLRRYHERGHQRKGIHHAPGVVPRACRGRCGTDAHRATTVATTVSSNWLVRPSIRARLVSPAPEKGIACSMMTAFRNFTER